MSYLWGMNNEKNPLKMSDLSTQTANNEQVTEYSEVIQTLINACKSKGYDYRVKEVWTWNEEWKAEFPKVYFSFRQDELKNSMIWFEYMGHGSLQDAKMMFFKKRYNGANGYKMKTYNQECKSRELLGLKFSQFFPN